MATTEVVRAGVRLCGPVVRAILTPKRIFSFALVVSASRVAHLNLKKKPCFAYFLVSSKAGQGALNDNPETDVVAVS
jgi:hypothetical protein